MGETTPGLAPGLYMVATPIGSARDITLRALDVLAAADVIAAEDTRTARKLMEIHGIPLGGRPVVAYHDHSGDGVRTGLLARLAEGKSVAYVSEAGTPLVSDPGYALTRDAGREGYRVTAVPGASAALAALSVAGLPSDRFLFIGFLPTKSAARRAALAEVAGVQATLILFEAPRRLAGTLEDCAEVLGAARQAAICRELTKRFEEVRRGTLGDLLDTVGEMTAKGEIVIVIDRGEMVADDAAILEALRDAMKTMRLKDAAREVAEKVGGSKRKIYQMGLELQGDAEDGGSDD